MKYFFVDCFTFSNFNSIIKNLKKRGGKIAVIFNRCTDIIVFNSEKNNSYSRCRMNMYKLKAYYLKVKGKNIKIVYLDNLLSNVNS